MGIGVSLILIAAGAILTWAVNATVSGVDINTIGVILMVVGAIGLILVLVILFEPAGIYGRWLKLKQWFLAWPLKRKTGFRRQKAYAKSERLR